MPAMVVDTDVVSFLFKRDSRGRAYLRHLHGQDRVLSFMTLAELDQWAERYHWGSARRDALERFLRSFIVQYADRDLCRFWGMVMDRARRGGRRLEAADGWIAATALALEAPLLTHNATDYVGVEGLTVRSETGR